MMIGLVLRRAALSMLLLAGCGGPVPVGMSHSAVFLACNGNADCASLVIGTAMQATCDPATHTCMVTQKPLVVCTGDADCKDDNVCTDDSCTTGMCGNAPNGASGCCGMDSDCLPVTDATCQKAQCTQSQCGVVSTGASGCCNFDGDCGGTLTCSANRCCGAGQKYCAGATPSCAPTSGCCVAADCADKTGFNKACTAHACVYTCPAGSHDCAGSCVSNTSVNSCGTTSCTPCAAGSSCQMATCDGTSCGLTSNGNAGCCTNANVATACPAPMNSCQVRVCNTDNSCGYNSTGALGCCSTGQGAADCGSGITCVNNQCCGTGQMFCGAKGSGFCAPSDGCCSAADCADRANAGKSCNATTHECEYTCNGGFHVCSDICRSDTSVNSCGTTSCTPCPTGNECQTVSCDGTKCGFTVVTGSGCCTTAADCPTKNDPCKNTMCVANICVVTAMQCDGGTPVDMAHAAVDMSHRDLATGTPDLAEAELSLSGGGGCALGGRADGGAALGLAFVLLTLAFRRRRAHP
jgi:hypothetical protein